MCAGGGADNEEEGLAAGIAAGVFIASIHANVCIHFDANQGVTGTAINILMFGVPTLLSGALFETTSSTRQIPRTNLKLVFRPQGVFQNRVFLDERGVAAGRALLPYIVVDLSSDFLGFGVGERRSRKRSIEIVKDENFHLGLGGLSFWQSQREPHFDSMPKPLDRFKPASPWRILPPMRPPSQ